MKIVPNGIVRVDPVGDSEEDRRRVAAYVTKSDVNWTFFGYTG